MSFPHLFIRSLVEVYRSCSSAYALFFPVFIHRILLHLGLEEFPTSELVHIIASICATFLRQRAAQIRASSKCPRVESSSGAPLPPSSSLGDPITDEFVDPTAAAAAPPSTADVFSIRCTLDTVITVQAAHGRFW